MATLSSSLSSAALAGSSPMGGSSYGDDAADGLGGGGDAAAELIQALARDAGWLPHKISMRIGAPVVAVEECLRTGIAAGLVRSQLITWIREAGELPQAVTPGLVARALAEGMVGGALNGRPSRTPTECSESATHFGPSPSMSGLQTPTAATAGHGRSGTRSAAGGGSTLYAAVAAAGVGQEDVHDPHGPYAALDVRTRQRFERLRRTVGGNFASVLTDPSDPRVQSDNYRAVAWDWLGSTFEETFGAGGVTPSGPVRPESVQELLAEHPITAEGLAPYVDFMTRPLGENRAEAQLAHSSARGVKVRRAFNSALDRLAGLDEVTGDTSTATTTTTTHKEDDVSMPLPWPDDVSAAYFDADFDVERLLRRIPVSVVSSQMAGVGGGGGGGTANGGGGPHGGGLTALERARQQALHEQSFSVLQQLTEETEAAAEEVELCLLVHVLSQSESFFEASRALEVLSDSTGDTLSVFHDTRAGIVGKGEAVVAGFMHALRLHRRRDHYRLLVEALDVLRRFCAVCGQAATADDDHQDGRGDVTAVVAALLEAIRMRFEGHEADTLGALDCLRTATAALLSSKAVVQESLADQAVVALHPAQWHLTDWDSIHSMLAAATNMGTMAQILQQYQRDITDYTWVVSTRVIASHGRSMLSAAQQQQMTSSEDDVSALSPDARRALVQTILTRIKTPQYLEIIQDLCGNLLEYVTTATSHVGSVLETAHGCTTHQVAGPKLSGAHAFLDPTAIQAALFHAAQGVVVEVLDTREAATGGAAAVMTFGDMELLMRVCFQFIDALAQAAAAVAADGADVDEENNVQKAHPATHKDPHHQQQIATLRSSLVAAGRPFRATLMNQVRVFFRAQHDRQQEKLLITLQQEDWSPVETVEFAFQRFVNHLCRHDERCVEEFTALAADQQAHGADMRLHRASAGVLGGTQSAVAAGHFETKLFLPLATDGTINGGGVPPTTTTKEELDAGFTATGSLLMLLQALHDYDRYLAAFPFLGPDVVLRVHDAVKLFDGQAAGLVLGAGAVEVGTVTSITTRHLALASQNIAFLALLVPRIRRHLEAVLRVPTASAPATTTQKVEHVNGSSAISPSSSSTPSPAAAANAAIIQRAMPYLATLGRVERDMIEHRNEFMAKIVAVVREHVDSLPFDPAQWDTAGGQWVMALLKEVARVVKHIKGVVRPPDAKGILVPLIAFIAARIQAAIARIPPNTFPLHRDRVLADLALLRVNVEKFGFDTVQCASVHSIQEAMQMTVVIGGGGAGKGSGHRAVVAEGPQPPLNDNGDPFLNHFLPAYAQARSN